MAMLRAGKIEVEKIGYDVTIANNPTAKCMYYIKCITGLLSLDSDDLQGIERYRDHSKYYNMDDSDKKGILDLMKILSPSVLDDKIIFESPELCGSDNNQFFKLTSSRLAVAAVDTIVIGGMTKRVNEIMVYKRQWLRDFYYEPLEELENQLTRVTYSYTYTSRKRSSSCIII